MKSNQLQRKRERKILMESKQPICKVLMLPWLAHGHLSPFLELAKSLTKKDFHVNICSTPVLLNPIRQNHDVVFSNSIQFTDIHLPAIPQLPPDFHSTKNLPPDLMPVLKTAFDGAQERFREILRTLKPDIVIYDFVQPWAPTIADEERIPSVLFLIGGAAGTGYLLHLGLTPDLEFPFPGFDFPESERRYMMYFLKMESNGITNDERFQKSMEKSSGFMLIKTVNEIEKEYLDYLSTMAKKEAIPIGALVQEPATKPNDSLVLDWLNKKESGSVVFVSFGSEYFLSNEEIEAVACGLDLSNVNFIWVLRFPGGRNININDVLPHKFQEKVGERGMLLEGWAPQAKILKHQSVGGFLSHCGWSSTVESITFGVPIIAMPMQFDQPYNAKLVNNIGVGMEIPKVDGKFRKEQIANAIKQVVLQDEGEKLRKKAKEMSDQIKEKGEHEMENVVNKLLLLVSESKPQH